MAYTMLFISFDLNELTGKPKANLSDLNDVCLLKKKVRCQKQTDPC